MLGDSSSASFLQLKARNIKSVVNSSKELHGFSKEHDINYLKIDPDPEVHDNQEFDYDVSYDFIVKALTSNRNVLIHCENGSGKSVLITLYFLMKCNNISLADSYKIVKDARDVKVIPRLWKILLVKERLMRGYNSLILDGLKVITTLDNISTFNNNNRRNQKGGSSSSSSGGGSGISPMYIIIGVAAFFGIVFLILVLLTGKV